MCSSTLLVASFTLIGSITFIQGQQVAANGLVIYDPQSQKQSAAVDIGANNDGGLIDLPLYWVPCTCGQLQCNCCIGIRLKNWNIDKKVCIQVTLVLSTMRLQVVVNLENRMILNISVSILNPPALCLPLFLPVPVFICFKVYDIVLPIGMDFQGCFALLLRLLGQQLYELKLGCVRLGSSGVGVFSQPLIEEIVSAEDDREDIIRGDNDGISLEGINW